MKPCSVWQFAKQNHTSKSSFSGVSLSAWYLLANNRYLILAGLSLLLTGIGILGCVYSQYSSQGGHYLYVGRSHARASSSPPPLAQQILNYWSLDSRTQEIQYLARDFARAAERQDRTRAVRIGELLCARFSKPSYEQWNADSKGLLHAVVGQVYLEQGWLEDAEREFHTTLTSIPPGEQDWGKSQSRAQATYGLSRCCALRGAYQEALKWLAQAPGEYNGGCGSANAYEEVHNYPLSVVWALASKPSPEAVAALQAVMGGKFTPMHHRLIRDNYDEQRQEAAAEAGLALGYLYDAAGQHADAESCLSLVAFQADFSKDTSRFARAMLQRRKILRRRF